MKKCLLYAGMVFLSNGLYAMDDNQEDWILVDDPSKVFQDNSKKKKDDLDNGEKVVKEPAQPLLQSNEIPSPKKDDNNKNSNVVVPITEHNSNKQKKDDIKKIENTSCEEDKLELYDFASGVLLYVITLGKFDNSSTKD